MCCCRTFQECLVSIRFLLVYVLWVLHALQSLCHPEAVTALIFMLPTNIVFSGAILWSMCLMIPVKTCWLLPPPLHPSLCAQWHRETWCSISGRGRNYPTKKQWFPWNTHGVHFLTSIISLWVSWSFIGQFWRAVGCTTLPLESGSSPSSTSLRDAKLGELDSLCSPPAPCPEAINLTIHL